MSVSAIASLRPLHSQCLRQANTGLLSVHIRSRSASLHIRATIALRPHQRRWQSDLKDGNTPKDESLKQSQSHSQPQKLTFRQFTGRAATVAMRNLAYLMSPKGFRQALRESPVSTTLIVILYAYRLSHPRRQWAHANIPKA